MIENPFSFEPVAAEPDNSPANAREFVTRSPWTPGAPRALLVSCSDGRLGGHIEEFLAGRLRLLRCDRVDISGGPGALAGGSSEYSRADLIQRECAFLVNAHNVTDVILLFHGAAEGGPKEAVCGDYARKHPDLSAQDINRLQERELADLLHSRPPWLVKTSVRAFRAEVAADMAVRFVELPVPE